MDIKVAVATHKPYAMPEDSMYVPLKVGAALTGPIENFATDDVNDNISEKNDRYCELTGLYFAWKNFDADVIGLVHYRRHFTMKKRSFIKKHDPMKCVLTSLEASALLEKADIIVPKKRRYYIESLASHYSHCNDGAGHLQVARQVVAEKYPSYGPALDEVYNRSWGYMFNMFIMPRPLLDEYCRWLFTILEELERRLDISELSAFEKRLFGRVSEILFNAWILVKQQEGVSVVEVPFFSTEKVNWLKKGSAFLKAKFLGKSYGESF